MSKKEKITNLIVFLVGGSARICKILPHLIAAKTLKEVSKITFVFVDSDMKNGDGQEVITLIDKFKENISSLGFPNDFIIEYKTWDYTATSRDLLYKLADRTPKTLENLFSKGVDDDRLSREERDDNMILLKAQFSKKQIKVDTEEGLFGLNNVGATIIKSIQSNNLYKEYDKNHYSPVSFLEGMFDNADQYYGIMIIGSLFGGTGSTFLMNLSEEINSFVNKKIDENPALKGKISIGGTFLLPYFRYDRTAESKSPNPDDFYDASYYTMRNIKSLVGGDYKNIWRDDKGNGYFDKIYFVGNEEMEKVDTTRSNLANDRGATQKNNMTVRDFIASASVIDFSNSIVSYNSPIYYDLGLNGAKPVDDAKTKYETETVSLSMLPYGDKMKAYGKFFLLVAYQAAQYITLPGKETVISKQKFTDHPFLSRVDALNVFDHIKKGDINNFTKWKNSSDGLLALCCDYIKRLNEINNGVGDTSNTTNQLLVEKDISEELTKKMEGLEKGNFIANDYDSLKVNIHMDLNSSEEFSPALCFGPFKYKKGKNEDNRFEDFFIKLWKFVNDEKGEK